MVVIAMLCLHSLVVSNYETSPGMSESQSHVSVYDDVAQEQITQQSIAG